MKQIVISVYLLFVSGVAIAQVDSSLMRELTKPIVRCEEVSVNSQRLIARLHPEQTDSLNLILQAWGEFCGESEPILRIKVLQAIQEGRSADTLFAHYLIDFQYTYQTRISTSSFNGDYYNHYRGYYGYVPFHRDFDKWSAKWAESLIRNQPYNSSSHWMALFLSNQIEAFNDLKNAKQNRKHPFNDLLWQMSYKYTQPFNFSVTVGSWMPAGKLAQTFRPSPLIGFGMGGRLGQKGYLDLVFNASFFTSQTPINLNINQTTTQTKATSLINFSLNYNHEFALSKKLSLDAVGGLGVANMTTDLERPQKNNGDDPGNYSATAIDIAWGSTLRFALGRRHALGVTALYHFAPFNDSNILTDNIGNQYATFGLTYRPRFY